MTNDDVAESLFTASTFLQYSNEKNLFLFLFKYLFKNHIKNLKWSSKLETKRKRIRFEVIVVCKIAVLHY